MNRTTWNPHRALVFARGLYHIAACDGLDEREAQALRVFVERVGLSVSLEALGAEPFDYAEAAEVLESDWLRRVFVQACKLMVQLDGQVSPAERDAMRALGAALGVGEELALEEVEEPPEPEALVEWIAARAVDLISWDDRGSRGFFWSFPHPGHPLATGASLQVADGQAVVVRHGDTLTDCLGPGEHRVEPDTLPGLVEAADWAEGPVRASLVFVRTGMSPILRWGMSDPVRLEFDAHGEVPIRAFGRFSTTFADPRQAVDRFARRGIPTTAELSARLRRVVSGRFASVLGQIEVDSDEARFALLNDLDALKEAIWPGLTSALARSGLELARFYIENLTAPLELGLRPVSRASQTRTMVGRRLIGTADDAVVLRPCVECVAPVPSTARFCSRCGASQHDVCDGCGANVPFRARFCPGCGSRRPES